VEWIWSYTNNDNPLLNDSGLIDINNTSSIPPGFTLESDAVTSFTDGDVFSLALDISFIVYIIGLGLNPTGSDYLKFLKGEGDPDLANICFTINSDGSYYDGNTSMPAISGQIEFSGTWHADIDNEKWAFLAPCVHEDMVVDLTGLPISQCDHINIPNFKKRINFGQCNTFVCIEQNSLGMNLPTRDLLLTPEHPIVWDGKEIKCENLINGNDIYIKKLNKPVTIYAYEFYNNDRRAISMHGVDVMQWGDMDLKNLQQKMGVNYQ